MTSNGHSNRLTQKQEDFCRLYFESGNGTQSALAAGYSPKTAYVMACENLNKPKIADRINAIRQQAVDASIMNYQERQQVLTEIGRGRFADFMTNLTPEKLRSAALQELRITEGTGGKSTVIKLHDPTKAIDLLNKMDGSYAPQKMEHTGKDGGPVEVQVDARAKIIGLISRYATGTRDERDDPELDRPGS